jgi:hypothetical protein
VVKQGRAAKQGPLQYHWTWRCAKCRGQDMTREVAQSKRRSLDDLIMAMLLWVMTVWARQAQATVHTWCSWRCKCCRSSEALKDRCVAPKMNGSTNNG